MASENPGFVDQYARARAGAYWRQSASGGAQDGFALIGRLAIFADQGAKVFPAPRKANALAMLPPPQTLAFGTTYSAW
jgi:hypothetical protein